MTHSHAWCQRLVRTPYPEPVEADAMLMPYRTLADYQAIGRFARSLCSAPVVIGYFQYYRLLTDVIAQLRLHMVIDSPVMVEISRPLGVALPPELLADGVLVTDDTALQAAWWADQGARRTIQIRSRIRRDLHDFGDNRMTVLLQSTLDVCNPLPEIMKGCAFASAFVNERGITCPVGVDSIGDATESLG